MATTGKKFSELTAQQKADMRDAMRGYKVFHAMFTELNGQYYGTLSILENTLGWTPELTKDDAGTWHVNNLPASWTNDPDTILTRIGYGISTESHLHQTGTDTPVVCFCNIFKDPLNGYALTWQIKTCISVMGELVPTSYLAGYLGSVVMEIRLYDDEINQPVQIPFEP